MIFRRYSSYAKGVKHWNGAIQNSWFERIVITSSALKFLESVTDEPFILNSERKTIAK